ncbi:MAG: cofactor-independent phosphoglycerate mutase [Clostridia bacterium]
MKYIVILGDGMADYPLESLGGKTPLDVAKKPNIDRLCQNGEIGLVKTVPQGMKPGSDVANLAMMGYSPRKYYSGRSPLEALSIGIDLLDDDIAIRCNLVTLSDEKAYADKTMVDYSSGEISTAEASELISFVQSNLGDDDLTFFAGVSYRHCLVKHHAQLGTQYTPPHDISDKKITTYLPSGLYGQQMLDIMQKSYDLLKDHPINQRRIAQGKNPANSIWLWGEGTRPMLENFKTKFGLSGSVISAVDLVKGIGIGAHMNVINVDGAVGTYHTNFHGKAVAAVKALTQDGYDYVYIHMEAPDECGHQGDLEHKILSIELIDKFVVAYIEQELTKQNVEFSMLIAPDHPTPLALKTHTSDPVPFVLYRSGKARKSGYDTYNEKNAKASGNFYSDCDDLINKFIKEN